VEAPSVFCQLRLKAEGNRAPGAGVDGFCAPGRWGLALLIRTHITRKDTGRPWPEPIRHG